jgi:uncharacterized Rmd1/YagE family protein
MDVQARARYLGGRVSAREIPPYTPLAQAPLTFAGQDGGFFVVFRFGAVVSVGGTDAELDRIVRLLRPSSESPEADAGEEVADLRVEPDGAEGPLPEGGLLLRSLDPPRVQVLAAVLGKSAVLSYYEQRVAGVFDRIEVLATHLRNAMVPASGRELLLELGESLLIRTRTVGRVEVGEKPEITWDEPQLDRLYERLAAEFELADRDRALTRKLDLISDVATTYLELLNTRKSIRLEWYIVVLILVEIVLVVWQMAG